MAIFTQTFSLCERAANGLSGNIQQKANKVAAHRRGSSRASGHKSARYGHSAAFTRLPHRP